MKDEQKPVWNDPNRPDDFAGVISKGVEAGTPGVSSKKSGRFQKKIPVNLDVAKLAKGVQEGDRSYLARSITLIESNAEHHFAKAQQLLQRLLPYAGNSIRIGITGVPGAGKSTFIEAFGSYLCDQGLHVAVLAVDPSSKISGGSILGDKTRMELLSRNPRAFIRPSPSGGKLGGVHRKTRETMLLCEAAGFDVILVETVGVGQSEVIVRDMVDFFMLLVLTGAGDELQGMKKGIMELADAVVVNKADGANKPIAEKTRQEYNRILHFLQPATKGWATEAHTCSALHQQGIKEMWQMIVAFKEKTEQSGSFAERRRSQTREWMYAMIVDQLQAVFFHHPEIKAELPKLENEVVSGQTTVTSAVDSLFKLFYRHGQ
ncbi:methylmalonyl Co-A mutase-associated GTPase MeaB [Bacillus canaveralius]|uniref:methylmalonyl Co-A mutase-associated GTPase MeaB n=1 Tax=Bacillus canaveralius TaxID=1403243 RepID=UPI000F7A37AC|nr:methylmalonyl Co-A mutase-associated GTPase MeaB [Bacillus canaveralius]RSK47085.1 methylmalonyl Co-A mutase-associated GTPase MeaB [Bacillus canaveralius]